MVELGLIVAAALLAWALSGLAVRALSSPHHHVHPNDRSMHTAPTPAGGGIAIIAAVAVLWPVWSWPASPLPKVLLALAIMLAIVSWIDDRRELWPITRLVSQAVAVAIVMAVLPDNWRVLPAMPLWAERGLLALAWLWTINLNNFMDGIDGLAASEAMAVALGYAGVVILAGGDRAFEPMALAIAGASVGYLVWNWHPARIFMGDVGSIPLGYLLGFLMLDLALRGLVAAALILPMYFIADATITLARRMMAGEKPWQAHRTHFYQRAARGSVRQDEVVLRVMLANAVLICLALLSVRHPVQSFGAAVAVTLALLASLSHAARGVAPTVKPAGKG